MLSLLVLLRGTWIDRQPWCHSAAPRSTRAQGARLRRSALAGAIWMQNGRRTFRGTHKNAYVAVISPRGREIPQITRPVHHTCQKRRRIPEIRASPRRRRVDLERPPPAARPSSRFLHAGTPSNVTRTVLSAPRPPAGRGRRPRRDDDDDPEGEADRDDRESVLDPRLDGAEGDGGRLENGGTGARAVVRIARPTRVVFRYVARPPAR